MKVGVKLAEAAKCLWQNHRHSKAESHRLTRFWTEKENEYWKIEISDFKTWAMGFEKFQGEWFTSQRPDGKVQVRYVYTMFSNSYLFYPFHWLFTKLIWRNYMKHVLENVENVGNEQRPVFA